MIASYLAEFAALSRMVKVRGACDKPFWIYKRLNNCAPSAPDSDDVLVVGEEAFLWVGWRNYSIAYYIRNGLSHAPRTFTIRLSIPNSTTYGVIIFGRTSPLKLNTSSFNGWGKTGGGIREFIPLMTLAGRCLDVKRSANFFFNITFNKVWKLLSPVHGGILRGALSSSPWEAH